MTVEAAKFGISAYSITTCGVGASVPASPPRPEPQMIPKLGLASLGYFVSFELMNDAVSLAAEMIESGVKFVAAIIYINVW